MNWMQRRRAAMMGAQKSGPHITLVNGTYGNTTVVTNGNHANMNPLRFNYTTQIPLTETVEVTQSVGIKFSNSFPKNTAIFVYWVGGSRTQMSADTVPKKDKWYEAAMSGTMEKLGLYGGSDNNFNECDISIKIDGEVIF